MTPDTVFLLRPLRPRVYLCMWLKACTCGSAVVADDDDLDLHETTMVATNDDHQDDYEDLVVFDDSKNWGLLTDDHRFMANTGSFTMVRDNHDKPIDIYAVSTPQPVLNEVFQMEHKIGNFLASKADIEEIMDFSDDDMQSSICALKHKA